MDVTPKSKKISSLKRRQVGQSKASKQCKTDEALFSESISKSGNHEEKKSDGSKFVAPSGPECTPVRRVSSNNDDSPQYPHLFRIYHDDSPEFRVGWDDGISETVASRKEINLSDTPVRAHRRTLASQLPKKPIKRFPTPPRLKQQPVSADVTEYLEWAKSLVEKAQAVVSCEAESSTSSSSLKTHFLSNINTKVQVYSSCDKNTLNSKPLEKSNNESFSHSGNHEKVVSLKERTENPVFNKEPELSVDQNHREPSSSADKNYFDLFDDSASDDIFVKCSQAVEDSLLKNNGSFPRKVLIDSKSSNNSANKNNSIKNSFNDSSDCDKIAAKIGSNKPEPFTDTGNPKFLTPKIQPPFHKHGLCISKPSTPTAQTSIGSTSNQKKEPVSLQSNSMVPFNSGCNISSTSSSASSKDSGIDIRLLDEDDDFLSSLDLHSLSQIAPSKYSISVPKNKENNANCGENTSYDSLENSSFNVNLSTFSVSKSFINTSNRVPSVSDINSSRSSSQLQIQELIKRKRLEAQMRLEKKKKKMLRHSSM